MTIREDYTITGMKPKDYQTIPVVTTSTGQVQQLKSSRNFWDYVKTGAEYFAKGVEWLLGVGSQAIDIYSRYKASERGYFFDFPEESEKIAEKKIPQTIQIAGFNVNTIVLVLAVVVVLVLLFKK